MPFDRLYDLSVERLKDSVVFARVVHDWERLINTKKIIVYARFMNTSPGSPTITSYKDIRAYVAFYTRSSLNPDSVNSVACGMAVLTST